MQSRFPMARVSALVALVVAGFIITQQAGGTHWHALRPGVEFATLRGEPYCRFGSAAIAALRLDPARVRLRVRYYSQEPERRPLDVFDWQRRTGALAVFNAGQYYGDLSYMGLLVSDGRVVSRRPHASFRAALVAAPVRGGPAARVLDLSRARLDPDSLGWREVAQSFMLFDHEGRVRVRRSDHVANRTAVAEDKHGHLVVLTTEGGYTLFEFAQLLKSAPIGLSHAMAMDGGQEAELVVSTDRFRYANFGDWPPDGAGRPAPTPPVALPAVITVMAP